MLPLPRLTMHALAATGIAMWGACPAQCGGDESAGAIGVSVREGKGTLPEGPRIFLDMLVHNTSHSQLFLFERSDERDYKIDLRGPDGAPVVMTNWGIYVRCVKPHETFRNAVHTIEPGGKERTTTIELNTFFKLDRIGSYRLTVRRSGIAGSTRPVYSPGYVSCRVRTYDGVRQTDNHFFGVLSFSVSEPYPDVSPYIIPVLCLRYEVKEVK